MRKLLVTLLLGALCCPMVSAREALTRQESDSVASALATVWGGYMKKKAAKDGEAISAEYMRGVVEALKLGAKDDAYFQGLAEGAVIVSRLRQVEQMGQMSVDFDRFIYKLERAAKNKPTGFTPTTADDYMNRLMSRRMEVINAVDGSPEFLEKTAKREGVIKTPSGLLFEVITEGEGVQPGPDWYVMVNYTGKLINGKVFNESRPGEPMVTQVSGTIPGFAEGLQMMKKGGKYRLYIPSELGYGAEGVSGVIPGGAATVFDIELLDLRSPEDMPAPEVEETQMPEQTVN
ncbi:MAG: FKBP-type peptidyl-prolyl cis-trans isomerase [Paramuribaculum sp.]|nr:FKBP-type peptidyl-prolyl cis-trans isomerase [Paramuribaculum sp.]